MPVRTVPTCKHSLDITVNLMDVQWKLKLIILIRKFNVIESNSGSYVHRKENNAKYHETNFRPGACRPLFLFFVIVYYFVFQNGIVLVLAQQSLFLPVPPSLFAVFRVPFVEHGNDELSRRFQRHSDLYLPGPAVAVAAALLVRAVQQEIEYAHALVDFSRSDVLRRDHGYAGLIRLRQGEGGASHGRQGRILAEDGHEASSAFSRGPH
mmetsp:Transcript_7232/g.15646  ORF Transcript_7232/g.15646 Transcript_7232/m.15646 type:complete len:209 (+) Transcript_7232:148-774(+)